MTRLDYTIGAVAVFGYLFANGWLIWKALHTSPVPGVEPKPPVDSKYDPYWKTRG